MNLCPECQARNINGKDCFAQLGEIIAWEYNDPDLLREHFLTVASYNLQHPSYFTDQATETMKASLASYLDGISSVDQIRMKHARMYEGSVKVMKPVSERTPLTRSWTFDISDIYAPGPDGAAGRVRKWAEAVREES